jgi:dihydrofolate synthase/folylpolyglutamate synthase
MSFSRYLDAEHKINEGLIRLERSLENTPRHCPEAKRKEMRRFLEACGNPQSGIPAVHVTGTSGKGSVSAAIAALLQGAGLRVGLHVSPYLQSATEKLVVDGVLASSDEFADLVEWVMPLALSRLHPDTPASIHGMASVAIAFEHFKRQRVDVIVCEVGCGGRFDLTSHLDTIVAVLTNVGLDHVATLGPTLENIAWHKAGIARPNAPMLCGATGRCAEVVREEARKVGSPFVAIPPLGDAWSHNRELATAAALHGARRLGITLDPELITHQVTQTALPGRAEVVSAKGPRVILDGAHNAEKLAVAAHSARKLAGDGPLVALLGMLGSKAGVGTLGPLASQCDGAVVTEPKVYGKPACPAPICAQLCREAGLPAEIEASPLAALEKAERLAGPGGTVLVTGSFYLVGQMREQFYSKLDVVEQRTPFPQKTKNS